MSGLPPQSTVPSTPPTYAAPSHPNLAAIAATIAVVGVLMVVLIVWLALRLRRTSQPDVQRIPIARRPSSYHFRPSLAPSEASSKFGFIRKSVRQSHRPRDTSWDFTDPDPFAYPKESSTDIPLPSPKYRPAPLSPVPAYTPRIQRASTYKDDAGPRTPTTPATPDFVDPPPPAYCRESASWPVPHSKDSPPT